MKCPYCLENFFEQQTERAFDVGGDIDGRYVVLNHSCPACKRSALTVVQIMESTYRDGRVLKTERRTLVRPKAANRPPPPKEVPQKFSQDYAEACLVLPDSAQASAALSRRCLQHILREVAKVKPRNLADEIQEVLDSGKLPSHIHDSLDAVRNIGNFAAHPTKSKSTGEILPVEAGEAEWTLDVLEALFDFYFVQPAILN